MRNQSKDEIHPLGYNVNAPLPYYLTNEDIYGKYECKQGDIRSTEQNIHTAAVLANFLNTEQHTTSEGNVPSIDEAIFVRSYLPHFYRDESTGPESGPCIGATWITNVAGHAYNPVDVIREGRVIYRVPPLLGRLNVIHHNERERSIGMMYKDMEDVLVRVPHAFGRQLSYLTENLFNPSDPNKDRAEFRSSPKLKYLFVMDEIFTYYGYDSILTPEIMSIKGQVMGGEHEPKSGGPIPAIQHDDVDADPDDDYLFG